MIIVINNNLYLCLKDIDQSVILYTVIYVRVYGWVWGCVYVCWGCLWGGVWGSVWGCVWGCLCVCLGVGVCVHVCLWRGGGCMYVCLLDIKTSMYAAFCPVVSIVIIFMFYYLEFSTLFLHLTESTSITIMVIIAYSTCCISSILEHVELCVYSAE